MHDSSATLDRLVTRLEENARAQRIVDAGRLRVLAEAVAQIPGDPSAEDRGGSDGRLRYRSLRAEFATALRVSEYRIESEMSLAYSLFEHYPSTVELLERGDIDLQHARVIVDAGHILAEDSDDPVFRQHRSEYERAVLEFALRETPNRLRPIARRLAEQWALDPIEVRHFEAMRGRRVSIVDLEDGMADLIARIPAVEAHAIEDRLSRIARVVERGREGVEAGAERPRSRDEVRADAFCDLLLRGRTDSPDWKPYASKVRARVQVIVPVEALRQGVASPGAAVLGTVGFGDAGIGSRAVSELVGYGPISTDVALGLAAETPGWDRVAVHPLSGRVLSVDRYRPSEEMRRLLVARDQHCCFPGCRIPASRCDIDHTVDAAYGGPTSTENLAHLCRGHHILKHHTGWRVRRLPGGGLEWTSPSGREHLNHPPDILPERRRRKLSEVRFEPMPDPPDPLSDEPGEPFPARRGVPPRADIRL